MAYWLTLELSPTLEFEHEDHSKMDTASLTRWLVFGRKPECQSIACERRTLLCIALVCHVLSHKMRLASGIFIVSKNQHNGLLV